MENLQTSAHHTIMLSQLKFTLILLKEENASNHFVHFGIIVLPFSSNKIILESAVK